MESNIQASRKEHKAATLCNVINIIITLTHNFTMNLPDNSLLYSHMSSIEHYTDALLVTRVKSV